MRNTMLLALLALYAISCASSSEPNSFRTISPQKVVAAPGTSPHTDATEFRIELERAYAHILDRTDASSDHAAIVDLEAAASIPIPDHRTINSAVRLFSVDMKESIQTSLLRSGRYRKTIDKALAEHNLPKGLAYLPVIESAYLPTLTSRAGAYGIWQFMPATAREYGLRVDWWVDERADPERSARAAAKYLKDLHRMFDDWSLALAAYNCGPGRVRRTLSEAGATSFWELLDRGLLPKETRGYVPTFYATLLIASDPETYGFVLGQATDEATDTVDLRGPLSLTFIAEAIGEDEKILRELNPALRRGVVPPGRAAVRVPAKAKATLAARASSLREEDAYVKYCSFTVRKGDTAQRLARAIGTNAEAILAMNGLTEDDRLVAGSSIYLPARATELASLLAQGDDEEIFYAVRKGDTLHSIAKKTGLSVSELRELNDLRNNVALRTGQKLRISAPRTLTAGGM